MKVSNSLIIISFLYSHIVRYGTRVLDLRAHNSRYWNYIFVKDIKGYQMPVSTHGVELYKLYKTYWTFYTQWKKYIFFGIDHKALLEKVSANSFSNFMHSNADIKLFCSNFCKYCKSLKFFSFFMLVDRTLCNKIA